MSVFHFEPIGHTVSVVITTAFATYGFHYLTESKLNQLVAFSLILLAAGLVHAVIDFAILEMPMHSSTLRRLISRKASIEGYWFEGVHSPSNPYSIVCIEYDPNSKSYIYHGTNFMADGIRRKASFRSSSTEIKSVENGITFYFEATVQSWSSQVPTHHTGTDTARGYGTLRFFTEGSRAYTRGEGEFFERSPEPQPNWKTFELYRIPDQDVHKALGKKYAADDTDYEVLLDYVARQRLLKIAALDMGGRRSAPELLASLEHKNKNHQIAAQENLPEIEAKLTPNPSPQADT